MLSSNERSSVRWRESEAPDAAELSTRRNRLDAGKGSLPSLAARADEIRELAERVRAWTTPSAEQAQAILDKLGPDLDRFAAEWGVDPRANRAAPAQLLRAS